MNLTSMIVISNKFMTFYRIKWLHTCPWKSLETAANRYGMYYARGSTQQTYQVLTSTFNETTLIFARGVTVHYDGRPRLICPLRELLAKTSREIKYLYCYVPYSRSRRWEDCYEHELLEPVTMRDLKSEITKFSWQDHTSGNRTWTTTHARWQDDRILRLTFGPFLSNSDRSQSWQCTLTSVL